MSSVSTKGRAKYEVIGENKLINQESLFFVARAWADEIFNFFFLLLHARSSEDGTTIITYLLIQ
jgi:hypothetical protein